jgi:hypothetical protein
MNAFKTVSIICLLAYAPVCAQKCAEYDIMMDFYNKTGGASWDSHVGWGVTDDCCTWGGVMCDGAKVRRLYLTFNGVIGVMPYSLAKLTNLDTLELTFDNITKIPMDMLMPPSLKYCDFSDNPIKCPIPDWTHKCSTSCH